MANEMKTERKDAAVLFRDTFPCSYFEDRRESTMEYLIPRAKHEANYHIFLARGYRRMGKIFYRNACRLCSACKPIRIIPDKFRISKSQKRTLNRNSDIKLLIHSGSKLTPEKIDLYEQYVSTKHADDKSDDPHDSFTVLSSVHHGYPSIIEMEYYLHGRLVGVGVVDEAEDALSSNYFYYDTDYLERRLGIFSILQEMELARRMGKRFYYLGFYIEENPKMSYKKFFRPNQILTDSGWEDFSI
jgi:arginine-tRNA-protein transferase